MDTTELKAAALQEQLGQRVAEYEGRIAELRAQLTVTTQQNQQLQQEVERLGGLIPKDEPEQGDGAFAPGK